MTSTSTAPVQQLLLVRHAATAHTAQGRFSGSTGEDPELSEVGHRQAERLAAALHRAQRAAAGGPVHAIACSPARRARQTAAALAAALALPVQVDDDLREIDFGSWEGRPVDEVRRRWPDQLEEWRRDARLPAPGGESVADVARRVQRVRQRLADSQPASTVLVVTHLYPVRLSVLGALEGPLEAVHRMEHDPTGVSELRTEGSVTTLMRYNDASHLRDEH